MYIILRFRTELFRPSHPKDFLYVYGGSTSLMGSHYSTICFLVFNPFSMDLYNHHHCHDHMMVMIHLVLTSKSTRRRNIYRLLLKVLIVNVPYAIFHAHFGHHTERWKVFGNNCRIVPNCSPLLHCHEQCCWKAKDTVGDFDLVEDADVAQGKYASTKQSRCFVVVWRPVVVVVVVLVVNHAGVCDRVECF